MKLLVLGGTQLLGPAVVDAALTRGHELTLFNRGRTNPDLYPDVETLIGDRDGDLHALETRRWDAVIDTCGYVPHSVRASIEALRDSGLYCFVSSIWVYADLSRPRNEDGALKSLGDDPGNELTPNFSNYGALKALCEEAVREAFGGRALVIRPGLIVGQRDPSGRFSYWPHRVARGGDVLAPGPPERRVQFIDARDLGEWMLRLCESASSGTFNATSPGVSWGELLDSCRRVATSACEVVWVSDEFLVEHEVGEWMELPLWIADPARTGANEAVVDRALAAGLSFRPLDEIVAGALQAPTTDEAGLDPEREAALLAEWHAR